MPDQDYTADEKLARIASRAHGVVTRRQLLRAGVTRAEMEHRMRAGSLIRVHPGVYRVGHRAPSVEARYLAAVRACGEGAALCGRAAGHLHRLLKGSPPSPAVVTLGNRRVRGIEIRRSRHIDRRDVTVCRGIPMTTVPRTLVDLAPDLTLDELARACHEAGVLHRTTPRQVDAVLERRPNSPAAGELRTVMRGEAPVALSRLERDFLKLLRAERLPLPKTNRMVDTHRVDCRWPVHRLTVELDSYRYHNSSHSWKQGYRRERQARRRRDEFRRYTWDEVHDDPRDMLRELHELLR